MTESITHHIPCPFCQQRCEATAFRSEHPLKQHPYYFDSYKADCNEHLGMIIRFCVRHEEISSVWFIIDYKEKVYVIKCYLAYCRIEEWEKVDHPSGELDGDPPHHEYVNTIIRLDRTPDNLTPETALDKLKLILLFS